METPNSLSSLFGSSYVVNESSTLEAIKTISSDNLREECAFYHLSIDELVRRVKLWHLKLPRVHPHYAVKCNDDPAVLKTLALLGVGFDCASRCEMNKILSLDVSPSRIVYAHPCKMASHLKYARDHSVSLMTFDSKEELKKVSKLFPGAELLLRLRCDAEAAQCQLGMKFGVQPQEARTLLRLAASLKLRVVGVAFHVGSGCSEPTVFLRAIKAAKQVFAEAEEEGHIPRILDIGGGFLGGQQDDLEEAASCINTALDEHFPESLGVRVIAEPGRYMVASAFTLATPIVNKRVLPVPTSEVAKDNPDLVPDLHDALVDTVMYFIDDGVYGSFNCVIYDHQVVKPFTLEEFAGQQSISSVWGPTCDGFDRVIPAMLLPTALEVGDWLVWHEMGAYTLAAAGNFNGFPLPTVKVHLHSHTREYLELLLQQRASEAGISSDDCSSGLGSEDETTRPSTPLRAAKTSHLHLNSLSTKLSSQVILQDDGMLEQEQRLRTQLVQALFEQVDTDLEQPTLVTSLVENPETDESREM